MQGVVYYANYLLYAEVGRVAFLRSIGLDYRDLMAKGIDFTLGEATIRYRAPLRFDEEFDIRVRVGQVRRVSWSFEYAIDRVDGTRCSELATVQVLVDRATFKAMRLPDDLRSSLEAAR
jgi:acyl-CoA thioester hydrolase